MNYDEALKQLESLGTAQTRKTFGRHGLTGPMFGVKYGDLDKLVRQIKVDHDLALKLWASGNLDARVLASKIVDPQRMTMKSLVAWMKDVDNQGLAGVLSNVAQRSPVAEKLMRKWITARSEWVATTGWMMLAGITRERPELLSKKAYEEFLATIESQIHGAKNSVRYAMNQALIGIGSYVVEDEAVAVAQRIGVVEVDHGDTSCKTPSAEPYIRKAAAQARAKLAKKSAGKPSRKPAKKATKQSPRKA